MTRILVVFLRLVGGALLGGALAGVLAIWAYSLLHPPSREDPTRVGAALLAALAIPPGAALGAAAGLMVGRGAGARASRPAPADTWRPPDAEEVGRVVSGRADPPADRGQARSDPN